MESPGGVEWWSVESDISVRTTASHLQKKMVAVACQAQVGSVYQETATLNYTGSESFKNKRGDSFSVDVVSASMASSHHEPNKGLFNHYYRNPFVGQLLLVFNSQSSLNPDD